MVHSLKKIGDRMVRVFYLIENGSHRFDHRARREISTMKKPKEYMAPGKPVVADPLKETMVTGGDVCQYVDGDDPRGLAEQVHRLAADAKLRVTLEKAGLKRVQDVLSWPHQAPNLLQIYEELFPGQNEWGTYSASA
jgi:glycosyltransferase involved in cell wall biosynthesis